MQKTWTQPSWIRWLTGDSDQQDIERICRKRPALDSPYLEAAVAREAIAAIEKTKI